jgi:excisionase family DNA binding protein
MRKEATTGPEAELLTTHQVRALLHIDRTTVYRMVDCGQLPAGWVGKQWRFARSNVEALLHRKVTAGTASDAAPVLRNVSLAGIQALQDTTADLLGVMLVVTDMKGRIVTAPSNVFGYYRALARGGSLDRLCDITWPKLAAALPLSLSMWPAASVPAAPVA